MTRRDAPKVEASRCGILTCACRKRAYLSRKDARRSLRRLFPGDRDGMQVYRCHLDPAYYHFGHPRPGDR